MRIGINALYLLPGEVGGTEIYLRRLLDAMGRLESPHEFRIFTNIETGKHLGPEHPNWRVLPQKVNARSRPRRIFFEQTALPFECRRHAIDVLLNPGFTAPYSGSCPNVTVFHDLQHVRHPENFRWWDLPFWKLFLSISANHSARIIAVSEATRQDFIAHYGIPSRSVSVAHHGVSDDFFGLAEQRAPEKYLFCVSTYHPHKNLDRLVRVFAQFRKRHSEWKLILTGVRGFYDRELAAVIQSHGVQDAVQTTGWVSHDDLLSLYRRAGAFIYPSRFEGFGMPVLEAMACGLPVACSSIAPLNEVSGGVAITFPADSDDALLQAMETIAFDDVQKSRMAAEGPRRARNFTWESAARTTMLVLEEAAQCNPKS